MNQLLVGNIHRFFKSLHLIYILLPPWRIEPSNSAPNWSRSWIIFSTLGSRFYSIIITINGKDQLLIDLVLDLFLYFFIISRYKSKVLGDIENFFDNIRN